MWKQTAFCQTQEHGVTKTDDMTTGWDLWGCTCISTEPIVPRFSKRRATACGLAYRDAVTKTASAATTVLHVFCQLVSFSHLAR